MRRNPTALPLEPGAFRKTYAAVIARDAPSKSLRLTNK